ncbi:MAG TPA: FAD-linked oxidase C-terminal domain-containing protein [Phycisphaerales bacterium]|nr:FAD-linked oxidase C-terminal domain-containing protein [Phycisphaerales bacterium]
MAGLPVLDGGSVRAGLDGLGRELAAAVEGEVRLGLHDRMLYATDASLYQVEPLAVVIPASVEDAVGAVRFCASRGLPILPRGGGTSLAGQCTNRAVVIDFSVNCRGVPSIDAGERRCRVEPGVCVDELNERLAPLGLFWPPDPATSRHANVGGCIGNNAAGARSIRYGRTSENVISIETCLADGTRARFGPGAARTQPRVADLTGAVVEIVRSHAALIRERFPKTVRRNAGYGLDEVLRQLDAGVPAEDVSLAPMLCGTEGTLAVTLGAELRLSPVPVARGLAVVGFASLDDAVEAVAPILTLRPTAVELLDDMVISLAKANPGCSRLLDVLPTVNGVTPAAVLYVEFSAERERAEIDAGFAALRRLLPGAPAMLHAEPSAMMRAWALRKAGEPLLHGVPGARKPVTFVEDNAVPVERLPEFVRRFRDIVTRHGTRAAYWAHASVGVLHVRPMIDLHDEGDLGILRSIAVEIADLARDLGGVMSGEHGDGRVRSPLIERFYGPELVRAFREVKTLFDPRNLLNPGNIVAPLGAGETLGRGGPGVDSITDRLRVRPMGADLRAPVVDTYFDYAEQHGFGGAVEQCNGAGVCRKKRGGTMCPSYMGTLDERHSTRGRGNALRLAVTGQFPGGEAGSPAWNDAETLATLDLCLSCKACKAECPSNVDVAKLKAEYLAQGYRERGGAPLAARVFGRVRELSRLASATPGLANAVNRTRLARGMAERLLGIDRRRTLPEFTAPLHRRIAGLAARRPWHLRDGDRAVVLFGDCFTLYGEHGLGEAVVRVLSAFGYRVALADAGCCGRAMISTGLLEHAIMTVDRTAARLRPWLDDNRVEAVLVLEPSCLSAIKDDWLSLRATTPIEARRHTAARAMLIEEFIEQRWGSHPGQSVVDAALAARGEGNRALFHPHCHQKALWGAESSGALLRRLIGDGLTTLDAGCCGMAGSFGYTTSRYDLSMRIGELALFPAVRGDPGATVVATGTSCRHQLKDGVGVRALHPVELLASMLG